MSWLWPVVAIVLSLVWLGFNYLVGLGKAFGNAHHSQRGGTILGWTLDELLIALPLFSVAFGIAVPIVSRFIEAKDVRSFLAVLPMIVLVLSFGLTTAMNVYNQRLRRAEHEARRELGRKILAEYPRHYTFAGNGSQYEDVYISISRELGCVYGVFVERGISPDVVSYGRFDGSKIVFWLDPFEGEGDKKEQERRKLSWYSQFLDTNKESLVEHFEVKFAERVDADCK